MAYTKAEYDTDFRCSSEENVGHENCESNFCTNGATPNSECIHGNNKYTEDHCEDDNYKCKNKFQSTTTELN